MCKLMGLTIMLKNRFYILSLAMILTTSLPISALAENSAVGKGELKKVFLENESVEDFQKAKSDLMQEKLKISSGMTEALNDQTNAKLGDIGKGSAAFKSFGDAFENDSAMEEFDSAKRLNAAAATYLQSEEDLINKQIAYLQAKKGLEIEYQSSKTLQDLVKNQSEVIARLQSLLSNQSQRIDNLELSVASNAVPSNMGQVGNESGGKGRIDEQFANKTNEILGYSGRSSPTSVLDYDEAYFDVVSVKIIKFKDDILKQQATIAYKDNPTSPEIVNVGDLVDGWRVEKISDNGIDISKMNPSTQQLKKLSLQVLKR